MTFRMSDLATHTATVNGEIRLNVRRPIPISRFSSDFRVMTLQRPRRLWEISEDIYDEPSYWALLAEWNSLPNPTRYILEYLPAGYVIRYLSVGVFDEYVKKKRMPTISGVGIFDLGIS